MADRPQLWKQLTDTYLGMNVRHPGLQLITLAQWALESGWASSDLAQDHLNFAGLKYRARMRDHAAPVDYEAHDGVATYCRFESIEQFIEGYWHFIDSGPYSGWEEFSEAPVDYIIHLHKAGYATDPNYVSKVIRIHDDLTDELKLDEELDRPSRLAFDDVEPPVFEVVNGAKHRKRGRYPNGLEGLIVHYDAFRIRRKNSSEENSDFRSKQTIMMGANNGYRYACISRTGRIFVPENWDWKNWGSHAGKSKCPETQRISVSKYYAGIEMNNPGLLYECQEDGIFCPWYNSKRNSHGRVILDHHNRCHRVSLKDEWYKGDEVRLADGDNITRGYYLPYTEEQFNSLMSVINHLSKEHETTFRIDRVFGHDEISPGRKQDPGGALAYEGNLMTMPQFRGHLQRNLS